MGFGDQTTLFCNKYKADIKLVVRKIAFESFKRIILKTPVDTGRARANWGVKVGKPDISTQSSAEDKTGSSALQGAATEVEAWSGAGSIFMTNNLPYIGVLEYGGYPNPTKTGTKVSGGFSLQAPNGMVRVTKEEMLEWIKGVNNA